mmetsp:Transcript_43771/g.138822  ORF Transcript_43771/g.138822 Transcript_43771/m.138822 type:complete len:220 (+) Transcript_43771:2118-2777(+)
MSRTRQRCCGLRWPSLWVLHCSCRPGRTSSLWDGRTCRTTSEPRFRHWASCSWASAWSARGSTASARAPLGSCGARRSRERRSSLGTLRCAPSSAHLACRRLPCQAFRTSCCKRTCTVRSDAKSRLYHHPMMNNSDRTRYEQLLAVFVKDMPMMCVCVCSSIEVDAISGPELASSICKQEWARLLVPLTSHSEHVRQDSILASGNLGIARMHFACSTQA